MALICLEDVARYLGVAGEVLNYDLVNDLIDGAQAAIEGVMHRSLATATSYTERHDGGRGYIMVRRPPITAIASVTDDAQYSRRAITLTNVIGATDDAGDNWRMGCVELWKYEGQFAGGRGAAEVVYTGGWDSTTLPADLRLAWIQLVSFWHDVPEEDRGKPGFQQNVPAYLMQVFNRYAIQTIEAPRRDPLRGYYP